ncbi:uncharacterized protein LOC124606480 [Schistocerca americana]|uniref:uncharacterized protein LOC124606480 n=1 Tax=Schistocerca americana TaxID=7009 RepID=UPI001F50389D|nr:uncharacterized protein LOC124606480 [Schistocerca americana]
MGTGASRGEGGVGGVSSSGDLRLPGVQLRFSRPQLRAAGCLLEDMRRQDPAHGERLSSGVTVLVERLVQRLVAGAGSLDPRFAARFLATFDTATQRAQGAGRGRCEYLVRLDALSWPPPYPPREEEEGEGEAEGEAQATPPCRPEAGAATPAGFVRLRLQGSARRRWADLASADGFLRRDRVQERFVGLLARAAARGPEPSRPAAVDESRLCGCPGKLVDVGALHALAHTPPRQQLYYGAEDCSQSRFPEPRDFRIAIVEGAPEVRLRVGLEQLGHGACAADVEVRLLLAVGFPGWPATAAADGRDFPHRVSLAHPDCLVYLEAATTGFYAVPGPPHPSLRCEERSTVWQLRVPAAELSLSCHYAPRSAPGCALAAAEAVLRHLRARLPHMSLRVASRPMLRCLLLRLLEADAGDWPLGEWPRAALRLLDALAGALSSRRLPCFFLPGLDLLLHAPWAGGGAAAAALCEEDCQQDADVLRAFLHQLHAEARLAAAADDDADDDCSWEERVEAVLARGWLWVQRSLGPPPPRRRHAADHYSARQLDYIALLLRHLLRAHQLLVHADGRLPGEQRDCGGRESVAAGASDPREELSFLVCTVARQARRLAGGAADEASLAALAEQVRRRDAAGDLRDDAVMVREVLRWLHRAQPESSLRPYLQRLFLTSSRNAWLLPQWRRRCAELERRSLRTFCAQVCTEPAADAGAVLRLEASRGRRWAAEAAGAARALSAGVTAGLPLGAGEGLWQSTGRPASPRTSPQRARLEAPRDVTTSGWSGRHRPGAGAAKFHYGLPGRTAPLCGAAVSGSVGQRAPPLGADMTRALALCRAGEQGYEEVWRLLQPGAGPVEAAWWTAGAMGAAGAAPLHCRLRDASAFSRLEERRRRYGFQRGLGDLLPALLDLRKFSVSHQ